MTEINPIGKGSQARNSGLKKFDTKMNLKESLFTKLDKDKNGTVSDEELRLAGYKGKELSAISEALFFAERDVNKWFTVDKNQSGTSDNAENKMWYIHNNNDYHKIGDMSPEEFAKDNNIETLIESKDNDFESWCKKWMDSDNPMVGIKAIIKDKYGKDLNDEETQLLYDAMKNQANRWLFKDKALYNRLNLSAYTRLATTDQAVSCCGGDVSKPPIGPQNPDEGCAMIFSSLEEEGSANSSNEMKNRLSWAAFQTKPQDEVAKMTPEEYKEYQAEWQKVRDMKASDYREMLKPENKAKLEEFETSSNMTVKQIVDYIDVVESTTGKSYDGEDWKIDGGDFFQNILPKLNGTYGDEDLLKGKSRNDIPAEKHEWLKYLEEHNLLLDQFKK